MKLRRRIATAVTVVGSVAAIALGGAATASAATHPEDAPPGYGGPFSKRLLNIQCQLTARRLRMSPWRSALASERLIAHRHHHVLGSTRTAA
jgi:hypothetical protein